MISFKQKGNLSKTYKFLGRLSKRKALRNLEAYAKEGVAALMSATPKNSGKTAESWYYVIEEHDGYATIRFCNSNVNDNVNIAVILQYGHATKNGGWVEGRDYINPAIQPIFDKIANDAWKEVVDG